MGERGQKKILLGEVISNKMQKTIVVKVERNIQHPAYKRRVKRTKKYKVHDETNQCAVGDKIRIIETRPLSREKRWRVLEVVSHAKAV
jgi:small subunit ribosomal protein S17